MHTERARVSSTVETLALDMAVRHQTIDEQGSKMEQWKTKFPAFPYNPYSIQVDFMNALYQSLEKGGIAMLESPTGTGKTLSIISSALQWLVDRRKQQISAPGDQCCTEDEPDWMRNFVVKKDSQPENKRKSNQRVGLQNKVKGGGNCVDLIGSGGRSEPGTDSRNAKREKSIKNGSSEESDEDFLLEEYESEGEEGECGEKSKRRADRVCDSSSSDDEGNGFSREEEEEKRLKVYFCSRTHSQLSQFVKELKKTDFGSELTVLSLGSRRNLCTNEEVLKLGNPTRINERCLELQKSKKNEGSKVKNLRAGGGKRRTKVSIGCPMLRKKSLQKEFKDIVSQEEALDIEDLVQLGRNLGTCPYYGSRSMVPSADLIVLPYQSLLSKSSREALGLNLKNNIVIIDEAHNLADSLISMYDSKITLSQLKNVRDCLEKYYGRFCNLLGPGNRRYIQTLLVLTEAFLRVIVHEESDNDATQFGIEKDAEAKIARESSLSINDFLFSLNIDNINFVKLIHYVKESNIIHKVSGYGDKTLQAYNAIDGDKGSSLSGFQALIDMLLALVNNNADGRVIISRITSTSPAEQEGSIKYVMLTGEKIFSEIATEAHTVVLTGGTLQPIEETRERLFPWLLPSQLHFFSCNHIVPRESILPIALPHGPSGLSFDFSYGSRGSQKMMEELGLLLCNLTTVVPGGIVVFFSSFEYEAKVYDAWKVSGILQRIMRKKRLFREPRSNTEIETVLTDYKETIEKLSSRDPKEGQPSQNGAVLLAVVGGKISEGINFSDGMGRCIIMVGLPYPSPSDVVLLERIKHIEGLGDKDSSLASQAPASCDVTCGAQSGFEVLRRCKTKGREYYENLCMKAVNQSIGRAIRHINDYAAILLVDSRYVCDPSKGNSSHPVNKLPQWIKDCLVPATGGYGEVHRQLHQFFRYNMQKQ